MPPPTSSLKPNPAAKPAKDTVATSAAAPAEKSSERFSKPDQAKYNAEQDALNKEIADVKAKLDAVRSRISLSQSPGSNDRRTVIKAELESLRGEQGKYKAERSKTLDEVKRLQESVQKKIKEVQAGKGKAGFRNVGEIDERIESLNRQIETGSMKLVDEKKALAEITSLKRSRKTLESSGSIDDAIAADRAKIDQLRAKLDDPESRKVSDRFDELKKEMDGLREEGNKAYEERNKLFDERNALSSKLDELYGKKRESAQSHREANDKYYAKVQAERQARQERFKAEKAKEEASRREEEIARLREEAKLPAFAGEIEDCNVLIGWFKGKYSKGEVPSTHTGSASSNGIGKSTAALQGVKELEIRKVDSDFKGMTLKKKGDDDELDGLFGGGFKGKKKGGKKSAQASGTATPTSAAAETGAVNLPMSLLSALLALGIPPPSGKDDVQRTVDDLETKKAWFEANSAAKTKAEIERVEKLVAKMQKKNAILNEDDESEDPTPEDESGGAKEPTHTVDVSGGLTGPESVEEEVHQLPKDASPTEEVKQVDSALEEIKQNDPQA